MTRYSHIHADTTALPRDLRQERETEESLREARAFLRVMAENMLAAKARPDDVDVAQVMGEHVAQALLPGDRVARLLQPAPVEQLALRLLK
ncbi:MAG: hypothetical protein D6E12_18000 [Desulfovibrio sp.]|nr:MAG: hypothetical protein D6E12_18000 [Desulfovibrio sp.]